MAGNSAGLIRAHRTLTLPASSDTYTMGSMYASGAAPTAAFSYPSDRYLLADAKGFTKFTFMVGSTGTVTTPTITFYFTNNELTASGLLSFAGTGIWQQMDSPSGLTGEVNVANPITIIGGATGQYMIFMAPLSAYRITTSAFAGGGSVIVDMMALA